MPTEVKFKLKFLFLDFGLSHWLGLDPSEFRQFDNFIFICTYLRQKLPLQALNGVSILKHSGHNVYQRLFVT